MYIPKHNTFGRFFPAKSFIDPHVNVWSLNLVRTHTRTRPTHTHHTPQTVGFAVSFGGYLFFLSFLYFYMYIIVKRMSSFSLLLCHPSQQISTLPQVAVFNKIRWQNIENSQNLNFNPCQSWLNCSSFNLYKYQI